MVSGAVTAYGISLESVIRTTKLEVPTLVGVPEMVPVVVSKVRPAGSEPLAMLHFNGAVPPAAISVAV
jgi:hypothetical protein